MGWREQLKEASFKGIVFRVDTSDMAFGWNTKIRETTIQPLIKKDGTEFNPVGSSDPFVELGNKLPRQWTITAHFTGNDYIGNRDSFINAIELGESGILQLPLQEPATVLPMKAAVQYSNRGGGFEAVKIQFVETINKIQPTTTVNTEKVADDASVSMYSAIKNAFSIVASSFESVAEKTTDMVTAVSDTITTVMAGGEGAPLNSILDSLQTISTNARTLIQTPQTLALEITDTIDAITFAFTNPIDAFNAQVKLFEDYGLGLPFFPINTPSDQDLRDNRTSMIQIMQNSSLAGAGRSLAKAGFDSLDDALLAKSTFDDAVELQQIANGDAEGFDDVYNELTALQAAIAEHINAQENLPSNIIIEFADQIPALVITEDLYGDADRVDEIVSRNLIRNPLFCKTQMSVLSE